MNENGGEVAALRRRVAELERRLDLALNLKGEPSSDNRTRGPLDRRSLLKAAGVAAAGTVGAMVVTATPAGALDPNDVVLGSQSNDAHGFNTYITSTASAGTFSAANTLTFTSTAHGLTGSSQAGCGVSGASGAGPGAHGESDSGPGVHGQSNSGNSVVALAPTTANADGTQLYLAAAGSFGAPLGNHTLGQFWVDAAGSLFQCVVAGTNAGATWVNLTSGSKLITLPAPVRVYDSRPGTNPTGVGPKTPVSVGQDRQLAMTANSSGVPPSASAVLLNLAVTGTGAGGFLGVYKDGITYPGNANINWSAPGQTISNAVTSAVANMAKLQVHCGGSSTDVIIDVIGYYP